MQATQARRRRLPFWLELPILVVIALVVALVVRQFALAPFYIPSGSMQNTLALDDKVLVNKLIYDFRAPERGEIIVFAPPANWKAPPDEKEFIKRAIGEPGDKVVCCDAAGKVTVNGYALQEPYLFPGNQPSTIRFQITVPAGRLFVLGDHRDISGDSRYHLGDSSGTIPISAVEGRAFAIYWPISRWAPLSVPATFDNVPAAARS
ncbi:signal peptidase I [Fodinicola feengrottensis]|uniref:Signal peptidase I n=1 Tax=Fodinicola feengrottensis TaxID=435914 RepID=A0ABP4T5P1_9ACTN|nr:signal peptidase I [Fodinicola feengrottensis]